MQVTVSSDPGSPNGPNEDAYFVSTDASTVAIFDGATARTETGCIHGVAWFVHSLADDLGHHASLTPARALAAAIRETAARHRDTCDLTHPGTPSAAVAVLQARQKTMRYLLLGDVTIVLDLGHGTRVLTDSRVNATARAERRAADDLPSGSPEKARALVRMKRAELAARNVAGGYWLAAADPGIVAHALTGDVPRQHVRQAALLSDGAARAVDRFSICDWRGLLTLLADSGPGELIRQVRAAETTDLAGIRWPRNKIPRRRYSALGPAITRRARRLGSIQCRSPCRSPAKPASALLLGYRRGRSAPLYSGNIAFQFSLMIRSWISAWNFGKVGAIHDAVHVPQAGYDVVDGGGGEVRCE